MVNITGTSSIRHQAPLTLSDVVETFKKGGDDQHVRFENAKGLHTHSRYGASMTDFLAFFRNPDALRHRAEMREQGAEKVMQAINNQFGEGMGERVFSAMKLDVRSGVTLRQVQQMEGMATRLQREELNTMGKLVGAEEPTRFVAECHEELGLGRAGHALDRYDAVELDKLFGKITDVVIPLANSFSKEQLARVAMGEVARHELQKLLTEKAGPLSEDQLEQFDKLIKSCFDPRGSNVEVAPQTAYAALWSFCNRGVVPSVLDLSESIAKRGG